MIASSFVFVSTPTTMSTQPNGTSTEVGFDMIMTLHHHPPPHVTPSQKITSTKQDFEVIHLETL